MSDIKPFTISVPDQALDDLKKRLSLAKFPHDELDGAGWDYGAPLDDVKRLTAYWRDAYDWRKAEAALNQHPHFTTSIQCVGFEALQIHFIHQRSHVADAIPLLFVHGWPGSFLEALKIYKPLTDPGPNSSAPAFHFVALSLPNYAFSSGSKKKGFALAQYAETCNRLMLKLGYNEYVTQGGDWGYFITRTMSLLFPENVKATHVNMDHGERPSFLSNPILAAKHNLRPYTSREREGFARGAWFQKDGSGYRSEQSTKPQTLGYAFADSPVALLAWIYEKLHDWTDSYPWTPDEICTWMSIYWFSQAGPAANIRIYYEAIHKWDDPKTRVTRDRTRRYIGGGVKLGLSHSPKELSVLPSSWTRTQGNVVYEKTWNEGGHFFAWEKPDHLVHDVRTMFGKGGGAYNVIKGKSGYPGARL
ncbi:putative epoxide hydrolase [Cyphellophora attinorum]|uniref:Putative epoxide hydrolase n=1 Tax=Cyphellophora attinorum TaxID=1664694 RepID=A0A0N1H8P4_9EURO|nr:putative epoxide hydrolase [Phialophora attinorum]KPI43493.1 putative epoxide hydrolase [Phialophora attinorum]